MKYAEIIIGAIASILAIFVANQWKDLNLLAKISFIVGIFAASLIAVNEVRKVRKEKLVERIESTYGDIKSDGSAKVTAIQIGYGGPIIEFNIPSGNILIAEDKPLISLIIKRGKLLLNAVCRDQSGKVLAVIQDNEWTLYDKSYEYNNDDYAFELTTKGEKSAVFQVDLIGGTAIVSGFFINHNATGVFLANVNGGKIYFIKKGKVNAELPTIPPIFKYPRERYLGVRAN